MEKNQKSEEANLLNQKDQYGDFPGYDPLLYTAEVVPLQKWQEVDGVVEKVEPSSIQDFGEFEALLYHSQSIYLEIIDGSQIQVLEVPELKSL